ncbi:hypothetical protein [Halopenitus persicus]|nr:hypothetical protein [Halopenitus persicus]
MTTVSALPNVQCPRCDCPFETDEHKGRDALVCPACEKLGLVLFD